MKVRKKILLIDDDDECIMIIGSMLKKAGFDVISAVDGQDGLEQAASEHPDLILLDVMMPEMDGWDTCDGIKANKEINDVPVVYLTSLKTPKSLHQNTRALENDGDEFWEASNNGRKGVKKPDGEGNPGGFLVSSARASGDSSWRSARGHPEENK